MIDTRVLCMGWLVLWQGCLYPTVSAMQNARSGFSGVAMGTASGVDINALFAEVDRQSDYYGQLKEFSRSIMGGAIDNGIKLHNAINSIISIELPHEIKERVVQMMANQGRDFQALLQNTARNTWQQFSSMSRSATNALDATKLDALQEFLQSIQGLPTVEVHEKVSRKLLGFGSTSKVRSQSLQLTWSNGGVHVQSKSSSLLPAIMLTLTTGLMISLYVRSVIISLNDRRLSERLFHKLERSLIVLGFTVNLVIWGTLIWSIPVLPWGISSIISSLVYFMFGDDRIMNIADDLHQQYRQRQQAKNSIRSRLKNFFKGRQRVSASSRI
ncbi:hypothetical protein MP228_000491 [Amoeboaphelidium protococcarum]|nr:hypothetical protein MP228_000491 [Amoeboaphelidium protococcarum]